MKDDKLNKFLNKFETLTKNSEKYLSVQENEAKKISLLTKSLYDFSKQNENFKKKTGALNKLIINRLDEEQIWQQIELQNNAVYDNVVNTWAYLLANKNNLKFPLKEKKKKKNDQPQEEKEEGNNTCNKEKIMGAKEKKIKKNLPESKSKKTSIVDDKFFKLHEMNAFLEEMEKEKHESDDEDLDYFDDNSSEDSNSSNNRPVYNDFFDQPEDDDMNIEEKKRIHSDDNMDDEKESTKKAKKVKFALEDENKSDESISSIESNNDKEEDNLNTANTESENEEVNDEGYLDNDDNDKSSNFDDEEYGNEEVEFSESILNDNEEIGNEEENLSENKNVSEKSKKEKNSAEVLLSTFEARQERLKFRINALEEAALRKKPWQMMGEVTGSSRPQNSLLQEYVEFDVASRPAPMLTEKSTMKLEDIIIQRIKDKAWDDVVRKIKPLENEIEYKKRLVLNQEKSKLSLAEIYEKEYLQQLESKTEDSIEKPEIESREHQEIRVMMNKLFVKLDALSNFHFTPKQVVPEVKIVSNLPAITMEEVAPVATSDAALLAPEEIKTKLKGDLIGKSERTSTDKKRERRQKKLKQKLKHAKLEAKLQAKLNDEKSGSSKNKISDKLLQRMTKSSNLTQLQEISGKKGIISSTAFFSKLQDENKSKTKKKAFDISKPKLNKKFKTSGKKLR